MALNSARLALATGLAPNCSVKSQQASDRGEELKRGNQAGMNWIRLWNGLWTCVRSCIRRDIPPASHHFAVTRTFDLWIAWKDGHDLTDHPRRISSNCRFTTCPDGQYQEARNQNCRDTFHVHPPKIVRKATGRKRRHEACQGFLLTSADHRKPHAIQHLQNPRLPRKPVCGGCFRNMGKQHVALSPHSRRWFTTAYGKASLADTKQFIV